MQARGAPLIGVAACYGLALPLRRDAIDGRCLLPLMLLAGILFAIAAEAKGAAKRLAPRSGCSLIQRPVSCLRQWAILCTTDGGQRDGS